MTPQITVALGWGLLGTAVGVVLGVYFHSFVHHRALRMMGFCEKCTTRFWPRYEACVEKVILWWKD